MSNAIAGILLAGGSGSRFGGGKLLAKLADGTPVGLAAWRALKTSLPDPIVVVRAGDRDLAALFEAAGARVVECADAAQGMSRSLVAGIEAAGSCGGWVIALGDMPFVRSDTISAVAAAVAGGALIALPAIDGARGHPVGFASRLKPDLLEISGDEGARSVVRRHADQVRVIDTRDRGILQDIDTRDDLAARR